MTTPVVRLPEQHRRQIVEHCLAALPEEGCGLLAMSGDLVMRVYPTVNEERSARSYTVPPAEHYQALIDAESEGWDLAGVFHSHPNGTAVPSEVDVARALDLEWVHLVVGLSDETVIRAWRIVEAEAIEVPIH